MAYWGCSTYPNPFLSSTIKIRQAITTVGFENNIRFIEKTVDAKNSIAVSHLTDIDSETQISKAYSSIEVAGISEQILARVAYTGGMGVSGFNTSEPHKVATAGTEVGVVSTSNLKKFLDRTAASVIIPVAVIKDTYYWGVYEDVPEEDNDSQVS